MKIKFYLPKAKKPTGENNSTSQDGYQSAFGSREISTDFTSGANKLAIARLL